MASTVLMVRAGYLPRRVSAPSRTPSAPSSTALATSVASALLNQGLRFDHSNAHPELRQELGAVLQEQLHADRTGQHKCWSALEMTGVLLDAQCSVAGPGGRLSGTERCLLAG